MEMGQFDGLIALKLIAQKKSFTAAAKELGVSPQAISQTIKQLESRVGIALLSRTTRSTSLTEAGEHFLREAGPGIDQIITAFSTLGTYAKKPSGLLRINTPALFYDDFLRPTIDSFIAKFPEISVEVHFEDKSSDIVDSGFDVGIRISDILANDVIAVKLIGPVKYVVVATPKYLNQHGRPKHPRELLNYDCIRGRPTTALYDKWEFEHKGSEFEVQVSGSRIFNNSITILETALAGKGVAYVADFAAQKYIDEGKLEVILAPFQASSAGLYLYYPSRTLVQPKLRVFIDHIQKEKLKF
jgi:DNA-binding transcriptional LysR family regulator